MNLSPYQFLTLIVAILIAPYFGHVLAELGEPTDRKHHHVFEPVVVHVAPWLCADVELPIKGAPSNGACYIPNIKLPVAVGCWVDDQGKVFAKACSVDAAPYLLEIKEAIVWIGF